MTKVSEKSKKNEILDAYYAALNQLKEKQTTAPAEQQKKKEEKSLLEEAEKFSNEMIVKGIANLKFDISQSLEQIEQSLNSKIKYYNDFIIAIRIAEKDLTELYSISQEAETLQALIEAQKLEKLESEKSMKLQEVEWEQEKMDFTEKFEHEKERKMRERDREEEEYQYNLKLSRQKDIDGYEVEKAILNQELEIQRSDVEKELLEREKMTAEHEQEYQQLKQKVGAFPEELQNAVVSARDETEEMIRRELQFEMQLKQQKMEGETLLFQQEIAALKMKIQEQENFIAELSNQSHEANMQVKEIACKAVEGASFRNRFEPTRQKALMAEEG